MSPASWETDQGYEQALFFVDLGPVVDENVYSKPMWAMPPSAKQQRAAVVAKDNQIELLKREQQQKREMEEARAKTERLAAQVQSDCTHDNCRHNEATSTPIDAAQGPASCDAASMIDIIHRACHAFKCTAVAAVLRLRARSRPRCDRV